MGGYLRHGLTFVLHPYYFQGIIGRNLGVASLPKGLGSGCESSPVTFSSLLAEQLEGSLQILCSSSSHLKCLILKSSLFNEAFVMWGLRKNAVAKQNENTRINDDVKLWGFKKKSPNSLPCCVLKCHYDNVILNTCEEGFMDTL